MIEISGGFVISRSRPHTLPKWTVAFASRRGLMKSLLPMDTPPGHLRIFIDAHIFLQPSHHLGMPIPIAEMRFVIINDQTIFSHLQRSCSIRDLFLIQQLVHAIHSLSKTLLTDEVSAKHPRALPKLCC